MRIVQCVLIAATAIVLSACGDKTSDEPLDRLVEVTTFLYQPATRVMDYPGRVQARYQSELSFQVEGRLIERLVDVGDVVKKGAPIAMLDAKDYVLSSESFSNQQKAAAADFERAKRDLVRAKGLRKKKFIGQSDLDKAINAERASYARLKALKAEHAQRVNQRGYTQLLAPAEGIVTALNAEVGNVVKAGDPIATFAWKKDWEFVTAVAETDVNQLNIGQSVMIKMWAYSDKKYPASVREISPISSKNSPSYKVKLSLISQPDGLKLGMTGHALFSKKETHMGLLPTSAIVELDGQTMVMVVDSNTKQVRANAITLGQPLADHVSIVDGLNDGQWVVIAGANKITDGNTVRVLEK
ncbi:MAG: efflux transporter periplasmic adaptor subunit [Piscirickettsiaceae bacterium]|nr:MAG: efflux transporter periplasmic adaptor subunit [Piscirickettsiaceae bacterium]